MRREWTAAGSRRVFARLDELPERVRLRRRDERMLEQLCGIRRREAKRLTGNRRANMATLEARVCV
eukprot:5406359-Pleurochrysis_carterae.AAC.1